jgi:hypothetical protein
MNKQKDPDAEQPAVNKAIQVEGSPLPGTGEMQLIDKGEKTERPMKKIPVMIRHSTPYKNYRRAGLVLTQTNQALEVTELQYEVLIRDQWVVMHKIMMPPDAEKSEKSV